MLIGSICKLQRKKGVASTAPSALDSKSWLVINLIKMNLFQRMIVTRFVNFMPGSWVGILKASYDYPMIKIIVLTAKPA